jgi:hypothetical protein
MAAEQTEKTPDQYFKVSTYFLIGFGVAFYNYLINTLYLRILF